ncbi:hypothetical protein L0Y41_01220 [bacterium]|nr:hypothetical protein [bacterium]
MKENFSETADDIEPSLPEGNLSRESSEPEAAESEANPGNDAAVEAALVNELKEKRMLSGIERLAIVGRLRAAAKAEENPDRNSEDPDNFLERQSLAYEESNPSPHGVTLGIEIEVPRRAVFPSKKVRSNMTAKELAAYSAEKHRKYKRSEDLGVPHQYDAYWEFVHRPVHAPLTLSREVQALIGMKLFNTEYTRYPLHMTVGGIMQFSPLHFTEDTNIFARALEATGWSTNGERLMRPYYAKKYGSWAQKGRGGIEARIGKEAPKIEVPPGAKEKPSAVEFRTFQFQSLSGLDRHLRSAYYLGSALRAFQEDSVARLTESDLIREGLANIWRNFAKNCSKLFTKAGMEDPGENFWLLNAKEPDEESPFKDLARILDKGLQDPESTEAKFIHDIRLLIIKTRAEVKDILDKERKDLELVKKLLT